MQQIAYVTGKGATDIALVIDAMDLLYSGHVDTFCLVANDSDYTRLAMRLRKADKRVVGIGSKHASAAFSSACDRFTFLDVLADAADVEAEGPVEGSKIVESPPSTHVAAVDDVPPVAGDVPGLTNMLRAAVTARVEDNGWALLSNVGHHLVANHPTFDSRNYGYARLGLLVRDQPFLHVKEVQGTRDNKVMHVRLVDTS